MPKGERWVPSGRFRTDGRPVLKKVKVTVLKEGQIPPPPPNFPPTDEAGTSWQAPKVGIDRSQPTGDQD